MSAQTSLVPEPTPTEPQPDGDGVDLLNLQASRALGIPDWEAYSFRCVEPNGILMEGGVFRARITRGKRKGRPNYDKPEPGTKRTVVITDRDAFAAAWEVETGKCRDCTGTRVTLKSAGVSGTFWRTCRRCNGTGLAPKETA